MRTNKKKNSREPSWMVWKYSSLQAVHIKLFFRAIFVIGSGKWAMSLSQISHAKLINFSMFLFFSVDANFFEWPWVITGYWLFLSSGFKHGKLGVNCPKRCQCSKMTIIFSWNNSSVGAQDIILFIFAAIILFHSISIHWTTVFFKARVYTFKKMLKWEENCKSYRSL